MNFDPLDDPLRNQPNKPLNENKPGTNPWDDALKDELKTAAGGPQPIHELESLDNLLGKQSLKPGPERDSLGKLPSSPKSASTSVPAPKPVEELIPLDPIGPKDDATLKFIPSKEDDISVSDTDEVPKQKLRDIDEMEGPWKEVFSRKPSIPEEEQTLVVNLPEKDTVPDTPETPPVENKIEETPVETVKDEVPPKQEEVMEKAPEAPVPPPAAEPKTKGPSTEDKLAALQDQILYDPDNIELRLEYINTYLEDNLEYDLIDEYLAVANLYRMQGQADEAKFFYRKVLELDPGVKEARIRLVALGVKPEDCPHDPTAPIHQPPAAAQGTDNLGQQLVSTASADQPELELSEEEKKQIHNFRRLLHINPLNEQIARKVADIYKSKNHFNEAWTEIASVGDAYMNRGFYAKALDIYETLCKECPTEEIRFRVNKARTYLKSDVEIDKAIGRYKNDLKNLGREKSK